MLVYLDANIVQYCADYQDYIFGDSSKTPIGKPRFKKELSALRRLIEIERLGDWVFASSPKLVSELYAGRPTICQTKVYDLLQQYYGASGWDEAFLIDAEEIVRIEGSLKTLLLRSDDRRHLAEAIALNASWFLTNDAGIVRACKGRDLPIRVARPSECIEEISLGLFLR